LNQVLEPLYIRGPGYEQFLVAVADIAHTACEDGGRELCAAGKSPGDVQDDEETRHRFISDCHRGFAQAQSAIGEQVIDLELRVRNAKRSLKEARRNRDRDKARDLDLCIEGLTNRQLVLRRIMDSVYFLLLRRELHHYKRFFAHRKLQNVDPDTLRAALSVAESRNTENPLKFTLVADLTTGMHMADLVEIDLTNRVPNLSFVETKTGVTNLVLLDMLAKELDSATMERLDSMGPKAREQIERMVRQHGRLKNALDVFNTDHGFDALNNSPMFLKTEPVLVNGFLDSLLAVCEEATAPGGVSGRRIDECLCILAIHEHSGFTITNGLVAHFFYHLNPDTSKCQLANGDALARAEVQRVAECAPFIDLGKRQLKDLSCPGLFARVPTPIALDIVTGKLRVFACFDIARFFAFAERQGVTLTWASQKESAEVTRRKISAAIPGSPKSSVAVRYRIRDHSAATSVLLYGFFARPYRDLLCSSDLVRLIRAYGAQASGQGGAPLT